MTETTSTNETIGMDTTAIQKYEADGRDITRQAVSCQIVDAESRAAAIALATEITRRIKIVEEEFSDDKKRSYDLWKSICDRINRLVDPYKSAKVLVDAEIARDWQVQERLRREAEAKARAEAAEAEKRERERLEKEAAAKLAEGKYEEAEVAMDEIDRVFVPVVAAPTEAPKTQRSAGGSVTMVTDISIEVVNPMALIKAIAEGKLPVHFVSFALGEIKKYVKVTGATSLPGVRIEKIARTQTRVA